MADNSIVCCLADVHKNAQAFTPLVEQPQAHHLRPRFHCLWLLLVSRVMICL